MKTKDLSIFTQMVNIANDQELEYKILYSYSPRLAANGYTESYKLVLCTNLFKVVYSENFVPENTSAIKAFLKYNEDVCIKLDFDIKISSDNDIELTNFR